jgi:hypothetical protein
MPRSRVSLLLVALTLGARATPAFADGEPPPPSEENRALATALFKEGRRLMEAGQVAAACRKFEESQRLDPGGGTLLNLAACHEQEGRTASAWTEFSAALAQARKDGRADRVAVAEARVATLEKRLAHLTLVVHEAAGGAEPQVSIDGVSVGRPAWGMAVPADPGAHVVEAKADGFLPWRGSVTLAADGDAKTLEVPALTPAPAEPPPPPTAAASQAAPPPAPPSMLLRDVATVGLAAVGVAGVALGSYFGVKAINLEHAAQGECPNGRCTQDAASKSRSATSNADLSTGAVAIGVAGLAGAAVLLFTRHAPPVEASFGPSSAALLVTGGF